MNLAKPIRVAAKHALDYVDINDDFGLRLMIDLLIHHLDDLGREKSPNRLVVR